MVQGEQVANGGEAGACSAGRNCVSTAALEEEAWAGELERSVVREWKERMRIRAAHHAKCPSQRLEPIPPNSGETA